MSELIERNYFKDFGILRDPYPYFEAIGKSGAVFHDAPRDTYFVTGYSAAVDVLNDTKRFSSANAVVGPVGTPGFGQSGEDLRKEIDAFRAGSPLSQLLVSYDGADHANARALLRPLFLPSRLAENEAYMAQLAERMVGETVASGRREVIKRLAAPFVTLVIADLLGVPSEDYEMFLKVFEEGAPAGNMNSDERPADATLRFLGGHFMGYVVDRRASPREDILSELANAKYPDGSEPDVIEIVKAGMFLFAAGQDTSAKLIGNSIRYLAENQDLQTLLRAEPSRVEDFVEEMLRLEGSVKMTTRLTLEDVVIDEMPIPAGKPVVVVFAAANRDSERWLNPGEFKLAREDIKHHLSFGRGRHTCIGANLARAETRILLRQMLAATTSITLDEARHGPAGARTFSYEPSFIIRGLEELHIQIA